MEVLQTPRSQTSRHDYPPQRRKPHKKISRFPDKTQKSSQSLHFCPDIRKSSYHPLSEFRLKGYFRFRSLFIRISAYVKSASGQGPEREILVQNFEEPAVYPWFTPSSTSGFPSISDRKSLPFPCFFHSLLQKTNLLNPLSHCRYQEIKIHPSRQSARTRLFHSFSNERFSLFSEYRQ